MRSVVAAIIIIVVVVVIFSVNVISFFPMVARIKKGNGERTRQNAQHPLL